MSTEPTFIPSSFPPSDKPNVIEALSKIMGEVQQIGKDEINEQQKFKFRGVDAVMNVVGPKLREHGVIVLPQLRKAKYRDFNTSKGTLMHECTVDVLYTFVGPDGSMLVCSAPGESADAGDKATAKAMSVAFRTALLQALCIPTGEPDPDSESFERGAAKANTPSGRGRRQRQSAASSAPADDEKVGEGQAGTIRTFLERIEDEDLRRRLLEAFKAEFKVAKAGDLPKSAYTGAMKWLQANKDAPPAVSGSAGSAAQEPQEATGGALCPHCGFDPCECAPESVYDGQSDEDGAAAPAGPGEEPFDAPATGDSAEEYQRIRGEIEALDRREIQKALAEAGLPATGTDPDLIDRLAEHRAKAAARA